MVRQLNGRCIDWVRLLAERNNAAAGKSVVENRDLWLGLDVRHMSPLATLPFVIVDAHFTDISSWAGAVRGQIDVIDDSVGVPMLDATRELMDEVAMFAWQVVRWDRTTAQLSLGMTASVAELISSLGPQQMREISRSGAGWLQLRWRKDARFWRELLTAASQDDSRLLSVLSLHAKLRLCSDLTRA